MSCRFVFQSKFTAFRQAVRRRLRSGIHGLCLLEAGAAMLFFGALSQQTELHRAGADALIELAARGYRIPDENDPVRVFPALTSGEFSGRHAGGWRPGSIYLRQQPQGGFEASVYLRHELFHEASHRSCSGRLPAWAEEAAAMHFSGESANLELEEPPSEEALQGLKARIGVGAELGTGDRAVLARLAATADWPDQPCVLPAKLRTLLAEEGEGAGAYILMSLQSGRILDSGGDQKSRLPPGSLLKLVYAAALEQANPEVLSMELAASDSDKLLQRRQHFRPERYRQLLSVIPDQPLALPNPNLEGEGKQPGEPSFRDWPAYLGGRDRRGDFPVQASLPELALTMRAALLAKPEYFRGLTRNGSLPGSTLADQREADKAVLLKRQAMAKTGTVSTGQGQPLVGHLLLAWPAPHPLFLAIFRQHGGSGAAILPKAAALLESWQKKYPPRFAVARVRLLTPTARATWEARADCPEIAADGYRFSVCGQFRIVSAARGSRSERSVSGLLHESGGNGPAVLETDVLSYADAVLAAEAQTLTGNARRAMRAVVAWNAGHGNGRHDDSRSLCDTTHCMVFLGAPIATQNPPGEAIDSGLLTLLDKLADEGGLNWLPFATGGDERWQRQIAASELQTAFRENQILDIRRERRNNGELFIHLFYPDSEETVSCEVFRNTLKLPSCPDAIDSVAAPQGWVFNGLGAGHGLGLSIVRARALSQSGHGAERILLDAYGKVAKPADRLAK